MRNGRLWRLIRATLVLPGVILVYLGAALIGAVLPGPVVARGGQPEIAIGLADGPIHYDFLLPLTPEARARFGFATADGVAVDDAGAEWLVVGWGARDFYTTVGSYSDLSLRAVWRGITGDGSVIRIQALGPLAAPENLAWLGLSQAEFAGLLDAVDASFARGDKDQLLPLGDAGWGGVFYEGAGRFHIRRTCNVWVGEVLRAAGVAFGRWTPTPQSVRLSLWRFQSRGEAR